MLFRSICCAVLVSGVMSSAAMAQGGELVPENTDRNKPVEITADKTLEWHRNDKQYIARGQAIAKQGVTEIHGEVLTADYRDQEEGSIDIWRLTAASDVQVVSSESTAYGDNLVYDIDKSVAVMKGDNLKMISPEHIVTAKDSFEYWVNQGILKAIGKAVALSGDDRLEGDVLTAIFTEDAQGNRVLKSLKADQNVVVKTPTETLIGDTGRYNAVTNKAVVEGNVKIVREKNVLEGVKAEVDLTTNISKMYGTTGSVQNSSAVEPSGDGRVRGVFYPSSNSNKNGQ